MKQLLILAFASSLVMIGCTQQVTQDKYDAMESNYQQQVNELEAKVASQDEYDAMESNYQQQVSELEAKVASQQEYIETMNSSIEDLSSDVDRFEYEDWQDVVPDVYKKTKDLTTDIQTEP